MLYIFDWDGTLERSLDLIAGSMALASARAGLPLRSLDQRRSVIGLGLVEALEMLYPETDLDQRQVLRQHYREAYQELEQSVPAGFYDGAEETLDRLLTDGHQLAVATGKARERLTKVLTRLNAGHYFVATRCADETRSKPHPLMLQEILRETGYQPAQALMIGDTDYDLRMAQHAGMDAVGVTYGAHPVERLLACAPLRLIDDLREL